MQSPFEKACLPAGRGVRGIYFSNYFSSRQLKLRQEKTEEKWKVQFYKLS
jgi:hypothetical protein